MPNPGTISAKSPKNSKVAQQVLSNIAKIARLSVIIGTDLLAVILLFVEPDDTDLWLQNFLLSKGAAIILFAAAYKVYKHWNNKNYLPKL
jgi:hypothetical protein